MLEQLYGRRMPASASISDFWKMSNVLVENGVLGARFFFEKLGVKRYLVNSATAAELCARDLVGLAARVERIFLPVALPRNWHPPLGASASSERARPLTLGTFGMPGPDKRTELIVEAAGELTRRKVAVRLVMAGFGCAHWAQRHADELKGLDVDARDTPSDHEFLDAMSVVDVAVQLRRRSLGESSGVVPELLALGRSVIVSDIGSFREYGKAVRTVSDDASPSGLADCIFDTWKNPVPQAAIADFVATHSSERFRKAILRLHQQQCGNGTGEAWRSTLQSEAVWHGTTPHPRTAWASRQTKPQRRLPGSEPPPVDEQPG
jgi:glycosyltransferase involved in cell wall biosynthesis